MDGSIVGVDVALGLFVSGVILRCIWFHDGFSC